MLKYILRRTLYTIPIAIGVSLVVFTLIHLAPGDPLSAVVGDVDQKMLAEMRASFGYDKPLAVQYFMWLGNTLTGDMGYSLRSGAPVFPMLISAAKNTITIGVGAALLGFLIGVTTGFLAGYHHGTWIDKTVSSAAIAGVSMPHYWLAIILVILFSVNTWCCRSWRSLPYRPPSSHAAHALPSWRF
jgi:peptide/nickel transport system permease protein